MTHSTHNLRSILLSLPLSVLQQFRKSCADATATLRLRKEPELLVTNAALRSMFPDALLDDSTDGWSFGYWWTERWGGC